MPAFGFILAVFPSIPPISLPRPAPCPVAKSFSYLCESRSFQTGAFLTSAMHHLMVPAGQFGVQVHPKPATASTRPPKKRRFQMEVLDRSEMNKGPLSGCTTTTDVMSTPLTVHKPDKTIQLPVDVGSGHTELTEELDLEALTYYPGDCVPDPGVRHVDRPAYILVPDSPKTEQRVIRKKKSARIGSSEGANGNDECFECERRSQSLRRPRRRRRQIVVTDDEEE